MRPLGLSIAFSLATIGAWLAATISDQAAAPPAGPQAIVPERASTTVEATDPPSRVFGEVRDPREQIALADSFVVDLQKAQGLGAATAWAARIESKQVRGRIFENIGRRLAANDLTRATDWLDGLSASSSKQSAARGIAWQLTSTDLRTAFDWASRLQDPDILQAAAVRISKLASIENPTATLDWASELPPGGARAQAIRFGVGRLADLDPDAAMEWVAGAAPDVVDLGVEEVARSMGTRSPRDAAEWAMQFDEPSIRDRVVLNVAQHWAAMAPAEVATWAADFHADQDALSRTVLERIFPAWHAIDPIAARAWADALQEGAAKVRVSEIGQIDGSSPM